METSAIVNVATTESDHDLASMNYIDVLAEAVRDLKHEWSTWEYRVPSGGAFVLESGVVSGLYARIVKRIPERLVRVNSMGVDIVAYDTAGKEQLLVAVKRTTRGNGNREYVESVGRHKKGGFLKDIRELSEATSHKAFVVFDPEDLLRTTKWSTGSKTWIETIKGMCDEHGILLFVIR